MSKEPNFSMRLTEIDTPELDQIISNLENQASSGTDKINNLVVKASSCLSWRFT